MALHPRPDQRLGYFLGYYQIWYCAQKRLARHPERSCSPCSKALDVPATLHTQILQTYRGEHFVLPDDLFAGHAPSLRQFAIGNVDLRPSFNFSIWKDITDLYADFHSSGSEFQISSRQWLDILRGMKQLEMLSLGWTYISHPHHLDRVLPKIGDTDSNSVPEVHLLHLRKLILEASIDWRIMSHLFPKLIVPENCVTSMKVVNCDGQPRMSCLRKGLANHVHGWREARTPFYVTLLDSRSHHQTGFKIDLRKKTDDVVKYAFEFRCYLSACSK